MERRGVMRWRMRRRSGQRAAEEPGAEDTYLGIDAAQLSRMFAAPA